MKIVFYVLMILFTAINISCSDSESSDSSKSNEANVTLTGSLGKSYSGAKGTGAVVSEIWATPLYEGNIFAIMGPNRKEHVKSITLSSGMDFDFDVNKEVSKDWLFLLIDSSKPKQESVVGYISMGVSDSDSLMRFPAGYAADSEIDLGTLNKNSSDTERALSDNKSAENIENFNLAKSTMTAMAKTDSMLKGIKNIYINYDSVNDKFYQPMITFNWKSGKLSDIENKSQPVLDIVSNKVVLYHINIGTNAQPFTPADDDTPIPANIKLYPPTGTKVKIGSWDETTVPHKEFGTGGANGEYIASDNTSGCTNVDTNAPNTPADQFTMGFTYFSGSVPLGLWQLKKDGTTICYFEADKAYSVDQNGRPKIFIPVPKAVVESGILKQVLIEWYIYDSTSTASYIKLTNEEIAELPKIISGIYQVQIGNVDNIYNTPDVTTVNVTNTWNYANMKTQYKGIVVSYSMNGVSYRFSWSE